MSVRRWIRARRERGQVLIIIAVALVGLLALAGLAIDGGNLFMKRRRAQNAADAAALAGTRLISLAMMTCGEISYSGLDTRIAEVVNEYAEGNGISDTTGALADKDNDNVTAYYVDSSETRRAMVGGGTVPLDTSGVEVEVRDQHRTYFLVVVGIRNIPSRAEAMAMAGIVRQLPAGAHLIPVGVPEIVLNAAELETKGTVDWEMHNTGDDEFCYYPEGAVDPLCPEDPGSPQESLRGWLNLNFIYNSNSEFTSATDDLNRTYEPSPSNDLCHKAPGLPGLRGWASGECSERTPPIYAGTSGYKWDEDLQELVWSGQQMDGDFILGNSGAEPNSLQAIYDGYGGGAVYAPVFDRVYLWDDMEDWFLEEDHAECPTVYAYWMDGPTQPEDWPNGGTLPDFPKQAGGVDAWYYHIVGWVSASIPDLDKEGKVLYGGFERKSIQSGMIEISELGGTCSLMVHGVTLWR